MTFKQIGEAKTQVERPLMDLQLAIVSSSPGRKMFEDAEILDIVLRFEVRAAKRGIGRLRGLSSIESLQYSNYKEVLRERRYMVVYDRNMKGGEFHFS